LPLLPWSPIAVRGLTCSRLARAGDMLAHHGPLGFQTESRQPARHIASPRTLDPDPAARPPVARRCPSAGGPAEVHRPSVCTFRVSPLFCKWGFVIWITVSVNSRNGSRRSRRSIEGARTGVTCRCGDTDGRFQLGYVRA
jgi:hypothetical protein